MREIQPKIERPAELSEGMKRTLATLTYRERTVIELRYGIGRGHKCTLEEVGRMLTVTRERVRQIEYRALRKMSQGETE